jgi:hypothetical protein
MPTRSWTFRERQKIIRLNPIHLSFEVFVAKVNGDNYVDYSAASPCPERPFSGFDALNGFIKTKPPARPIIIESTYVADALMWVLSWLFVNAGNLYGLRHEKYTSLSVPRII